MTYDLTKTYVTRDGRQAKIFMLDNGVKVMLGIVQQDNGFWFSNGWNENGKIYDNHETSNDIVGEWREKIKYSVELWGNEWKPVLFDHGFSALLLGYKANWGVNKKETTPIKYRITVEEIEEGEK